MDWSIHLHVLLLPLAALCQDGMHECLCWSSQARILHLILYLFSMCRRSGHYYSNPNNNMWKILRQTGIAPPSVSGSQVQSTYTLKLEPHLSWRIWRLPLSAKCCIGFCIFFNLPSPPLPPPALIFFYRPPLCYKEFKLPPSHKLWTMYHRKGF